MTELKNKPLGEWTLEEVKGICTGECELCSFAIGDLYECILGSSPRNWSLPKKHRLTESEIAICKAVGAKWVSRDDNDLRYVKLWSGEPKKDIYNVYSGYFCSRRIFLAEINAELFPSIQQGDLVCMEESL